MASLEWQFLYINKAGQRLIGTDPHKIAEMKGRDLWDEHTLPTVLEKALPAQVKGETFRFN
jgi:hypothetical protein